MSWKQERLKKALQDKIKAQVEEMLKSISDDKQLSLTEIEELVLETRQEIGQVMTQALAEVESQPLEPDCNCPTCGRKMQHKGKKPKQLTTQSGDIVIERDYCYCPNCRAGFFPLDKAWELSRGRLSPGMSHQVVWLSGLLPYQQVQAVLRRTRQPVLPTTSIWEETQRQGQGLVECAAFEREHVNIERTQWDHRLYNARQYKSVSMDGGMVYLRGEGWKELKAGVVADIEHDWHTSQKPVMQLKNLSYTAVIGDVACFAKAFWALAYRRGVTYAGRYAVTADGAPWIWRLADDLFPYAVQIVDWYHALEHLAHAAEARHANSSPLAQHWYRQMKDHLFRGELHRIIEDLHAHDLHTHALYFIKHQHRMHYQAFRAEGYPIGSGAVESGIKQFKHRFTGAGMRWSRAGAERMVIIRSAILSDTFDDLWQAA